VAIEWGDGVVKPHPPMVRAMREVATCTRLGFGLHVIFP